LAKYEARASLTKGIAIGYLDLHKVRSLIFVHCAFVQLLQVQPQLSLPRIASIYGKKRNLKMKTGLWMLNLIPG